MGSIQILDGGLGTSLEDQYGVKFDHSMPLWSTHFIIEGESTLQACQRDFVDAGVDILLTATYQTSIEGFSRTRTDEFPDGIPRTAIPRYLAKAMAIAEAARGGGTTTKLALSLGPYGACMVPGQEYSGRYDAAHDSEDALYRWHLERLRLFDELDGGLCNRVQYVALETIPRLDEIRAVRRAVRDAGITAPFWVTCVFPGEGRTLPDGSSVDDVVGAMLDPEVGGAVPWGIGLNCTKIHLLPGLVEAFEVNVRKLMDDGRVQSAPSMVLYPDGTNGEVYNTTTKEWEMPAALGQGKDARVS
jgi:homocysteine S-methyltransferase